MRFVMSNQKTDLPASKSPPLIHLICHWLWTQHDHEIFFWRIRDCQERERKKRQMQNNAWIDYLAWGLVGGNQWGCDIIRKFLWVGAPSFAVATCKIMGWGNNRTTKVAKHRGGKKCACLHMHKKMTYLSRLFQEIRVCLIIKLPSNWMMDNEYAQYIKLIVIIYQVGAEIFSFC